MSYALLAEVNTFHEQRVKDVKSSHQHFLQEQIKFYQKVRRGEGIYISFIIYDFHLQITERLQDTLKLYDQF